MWMMKCRKCKKYIGNADLHLKECQPDNNTITTFVKKAEAQEFIQKNGLVMKDLNVICRVDIPQD